MSCPPMCWFALRDSSDDDGGANYRCVGTAVPSWPLTSRT